MGFTFAPGFPVPRIGACGLRSRELANNLTERAAPETSRRLFVSS